VVVLVGQDLVAVVLVDLEQQHLLL